MLDFLEEIFEVLRDWHVSEGRALRRAALLLIGFPFVLIALGAVAEGLLHSFHAKILLISLANIWMGIIFAWMAVRRVIIAAEVGLPILSASRTGDDDPTPSAAVDAAMYYARGVAAVLASETAAGLIVVLLPVYANISAALLVLSTSITFLSWWVWRQEGVERWANIVYNLACANVVLGLLLIISSAYLPESFATIFSSLGGADARLVSITKLEADVITVAKMLLVVLVIFYLATAFAREKLQVRTFLQRLAVVVIISLLVIMVLRVQKGESKEEKSIKDFVTSMGKGENPTSPPTTSTPSTLSVSVTATNPGDLGVLLKAEEGKRVAIHSVRDSYYGKTGFYTVPKCVGKRIRAEVTGGPWDGKVPVIQQVLDNNTYFDFRDVPDPSFRDPDSTTGWVQKIPVVPLHDLGIRLEGGGRLAIFQSATLTLWCEPII